MNLSIKLVTASRYICLALLVISINACKGKNEEAAGTEETTSTREPVVISQTDDKEVSVVKQTDVAGKVTATITTSTKDGNEVRTEDRIIRGTPQEVDAKIKELTSNK